MQALLVSVGGAPAPVIYTLNQQQPPYICFFVSPDTKEKITKEILPQLSYAPQHYDWIETLSAEDLNACCSKLFEELPRLLKKWNVDWRDLGVDYTGGTKTMSVAVALATVENVAHYTYIGSADPTGRSKNGVGIVLDGREKMWYQSNPWEEMAILARREIALLFNRARYGAAYEHASHLAEMVSTEMRPVYQALAQSIAGYDLWDRFDYKSAQSRLNSARQVLHAYIAGRDARLRTLVEHLETNFATLIVLAGKESPEKHQAYLLDLLSNAARRADLEGKHDDATARLYSALEALARYTLLDEYNIHNGKVRAEQIPEQVRDDYRRSWDEQEGVYKLGLHDSFALLAALGNAIGQKYQAVCKDLRAVLNVRNQSPLAHGTDPVRADTYARLRDLLLSFMEIQKEKLPQFPTLEF